MPQTRARGLASARPRREKGKVRRRWASPWPLKILEANYARVHQAEAGTEIPAKASKKPRSESGISTDLGQQNNKTSLRRDMNALARREAFQSSPRLRTRHKSSFVHEATQKKPSSSRGIEVLAQREVLKSSLSARHQIKPSLSARHQSPRHREALKSSLSARYSSPRSARGIK